MTATIKNRYEFVVLFDVKNGNPNGDPDAGNLPRIDPETSHGIVTDVCLKRKIRNFVEITKKDQTPYNIYVKERSILTQRRQPAYDSVTDIKDKAEKISKARDWMCHNFYDVRTFGAVMAVTDNNCGQVRGPVQFSFAESIDPVVSLEATITRMAVETAKESQAQEGGNRTMGRKTYVPYGLYRTHGYISAAFAKQTRFSEEDLELLWESLMNMFDHDRSAARGEMATRNLIVFKHESELGNAPAQQLFDLIKIERVGDQDKPPRSFSDYEVIVGEAPKGVELIVKL